MRIAIAIAVAFAIFLEICIFLSPFRFIAKLGKSPAITPHLVSCP
jgi:hypothetical protein